MTRCDAASCSHAVGLADAALGWQAGGRPAARRIEDLLYGQGQPAWHRRPNCAPQGTPRADFQTSRCDRLATALPRLIATAAATRDSADASTHAAASTRLAETYIVAANFMTKLNDDPWPGR